MTKKRYWLKVLFTVLLVVPVGCFANGNGNKMKILNNMNKVSRTRVLISAVFCTLLISCTLTSNNTEERHLFILSGQSNMVRLDPSETFIPALEETFDKNNIVVIKDAKGTQPIRRWYKNWQSASGDMPKGNGDLYERLMTKVQQQAPFNQYQTITFIWMQGERDAREQHGDVYAQSLAGLIQQLSDDLGRNDINFVIGRLSDFGTDNKNFPHWNKVRQAQMYLANNSSRGSWVNTDEFNDGINQEGKEITNDIHYSVKGYQELGNQFAAHAIELIKASK